MGLVVDAGFGVEVGIGTSGVVAGECLRVGAVFVLVLKCLGVGLVLGALAGWVELRHYDGVSGSTRSEIEGSSEGGCR